MEKPLAGSNPMLHFQIRTPSTGVRPSTTLFHGLVGVEDRPVHGRVQAAEGDDLGRRAVGVEFSLHAFAGLRDRQHALQTGDGGKQRRSVAPPQPPFLFPATTWRR